MLIVITRRNKYIKKASAYVQEISNTETRSLQENEPVLESAEYAYKISLPHIFEDNTTLTRNIISLQNQFIGEFQMLKDSFELVKNGYFKLQQEKNSLLIVKFKKKILQ